MTPITVLTPTGTLGYGFGAEALRRGMSLRPQVIAVDAGSTDPGPHYLGSGETLVSRYVMKRELTDLILAGRGAGIPVIVGSAGGSGSHAHVEWTLAIVREIAREQGVHFRLAAIHADIPRERIHAALGRGEIDDFEAGYPLTNVLVDESNAIVAQMGHEPIAAALESGADVIVAGRACDDSTIAAFPIWKGADPGLAIHMGKILECGAFSAEPFGMDVMLGTVDARSFVLEPGSVDRRASLTSVAAHSLYEREDPFEQAGPGHRIDMSACRYEQVNDRQVRVTGTRFVATPEYWVKLEGARPAGYRTVSIAGIRCPTMIARIDGILDDMKARTEAYFAPERLAIVYHVYGRDGVMRALEPRKAIASHELGLVIDVVAASQELAHAACHFLSGGLLHYHYPGQYNTAGNLAFPHSPSEIDAGLAYEFSAYHLMKARSSTELFPITIEEL